jgi:hypothetical protein
MTKENLEPLKKYSEYDRVEYVQTRGKGTPPSELVCTKCGSNKDIFVMTVEIHGDKSILESQRNNWVKPMRLGWRCMKCAQPVIDAVASAVSENK